MPKDKQVEAKSATGHRHMSVFHLPFGHEPGMKVPKGGSSCAKCEYLGKDGASCSSKYFIEWNGGNKLPAPADSYCSDWFEPAKKEK